MSRVRTRMRAMGPVTGLPAVKEIVPPSPASEPSSYSAKNHRRSSDRHSSRLQQPRSHVMIKASSRSLGDDLESSAPSGTTVATGQMISPPRTSSDATVSPKLSPISYASSTTRQQEQRHRQQDLREPPSPFQIQQQQQVDESKISLSALNDSQTVASQSRSEAPRKFQIHDGTGDTGDAEEEEQEDEEDDFVDLTDLFVLLQRREWEKVYAFLRDHPKSSLQTIHSKKGTTPLLHIVLRHGPPLPVVNILLSQEVANNTTGKSSSSYDVWKQTDMNGRLPLHAACACGPDASLDVISRLISADPDALQMRTKDEHGRFPLHLAVVTNASEDVVMELMINFPDASFIPDTHGKIPLDYAQEACYGHNRLVVALEWAPMFLAASQAASNRISKTTDIKLTSLREAHAAYEEQLENRYNNEKMVLVREQINCSDQLTSEKERNIAMAEAMLEMRKSNQDLSRERDVLKSKLDREIRIRKLRIKTRDEELKQILLGKKNRKENEKGKNEKGGEKANDDKDGKDTSEGVDTSISDVSLPTLLKRISQGYETSKRRNELYKKHLERHRATNQKLNATLAKKETELKQADRKSQHDKIALQAAIDRAEDLALQHENVMAKLVAAREEVERWKRAASEGEQKLAHSERRLRIQGKRLSGVQDLIESLKLAKADNASRLELVQEEGDRENGDASGETSGARSPSMMRKANDLSVDLSVEIEMAAMAAAHLDDSTSSFNTSPSARRRQADLSAELAAVTASSYNRPLHEDRGASPLEPRRIPYSEMSPSAKQQQSKHRRGTNTETDEGASRKGATPKTLSSNTATTASFGEDGFGDHSMHRSTPETPPVPKHVKSRSRRAFDQCSPLGTPKLDFTRDA